MKKPIPVVKLENISKTFPGVQALESVGFEVFPGEIVAVIGENGAGKSTLMNILAGVLQPDEGKITISGETVPIGNPNVSQKLGISVVYQEMSTCPNLSVAENISLIEVSRQSSLGLIDRKKIKNAAKAVLFKLALNNLNLNAPVGNLSIAHQQLVEIAKAISTNARLVIFDEPTSALTEEDANNLFQIIRELKADGVSILYVSHHFEDVISLADRVVVLRDGKQIDILDIDKVTVDKLIEKVAGSAVVDLYKSKAKNSASAEIGLEVIQLSDNKKIQNISFSVNKGMILGIAGLPDSGKDELGECLYGLRACQGKIIVDGNQVSLNTPTGAINKGISYVPANRRESGAILSMNVRDNIIASSIKHHSKAGVLNKKDILTTAKKFVKDLSIKISKITQMMSTISGGNQQKIILSKCLATNPSILLLHEPTRGIDVGAKAEIYKILEELAEKKVTIVIISSELIELISQCNQIFVMYEGKIRGKFDQEEFDEKKIVSCLMGESICL